MRQSLLEKTQRPHRHLSLPVGLPVVRWPARRGRAAGEDGRARHPRACCRVGAERLTAPTPTGYNRSRGPCRPCRSHTGSPEEQAHVGAGGVRADAGAPPAAHPRSAAPRVAEGDEAAAFAARCAAAEASAGVLDVLGATVRDGAHGPCVVVDRHYPASGQHGHHLIERYLAAARASLGVLPWFLDQHGTAAAGPGNGPGPRLVCFDLETTGLSGGAGTYAFLVGFGYFDDEGFRTRQFFLRGFGEERALLHAVEEEIALGEAADPGGPRHLQRPGVRRAAHRHPVPDAPPEVAVRQAAARGHALPGAETLEAPGATG